MSFGANLLSISYQVVFLLLLSNVQKITSAEIGSNFSLESFMRQPHPVRGDIR